MRFLFFSFLCCLTISFAADKPVPLAPKGASSEDASGLELFADVALGHIDTGKRKRKLSSEQLEETKGEMPDAKKTRHSASPAPNASSSADDSFRTASKKRRPEEEELLESKRQTPSKKRRLTSPSSSSSGDLSLESDEEEAVFFPTEAPVDQVQEDVQEDLQEEISAIERLAKRALKEKKYFAKLEERAQISTEAQYQLARLLDETSDIKGRGDHIKPDLQRATDLYLSSIKTEHAPAISDLERLIVRKDILNYSNAKNFIKFVRKGIVREDKLLSLLKQFAVGKGSGGNSPTNVSRAIKDLTTFNVENNPLICSASVLLRCADTLVNERKRICECLTSGIDPRTGKKGISNVSKKLFDDSTYGDQRYKIDEMTGDLLHAAATAHEDRDAAWKFYVFCKSTPNYHRHENKMERIYPILLKEKEYFQAAEGYDYTKILNEAAETYLCSYFNGYASPDSRMAPKQLFALIQENLESLIKQVASSPAVGAEKEELLKNIFSNIEKLTRGLARQYFQADPKWIQEWTKEQTPILEALLLDTFENFEGEYKQRKYYLDALCQFAKFSEIGKTKALEVLEQDDPVIQLYKADLMAYAAKQEDFFITYDKGEYLQILRNIISQSSFLSSSVNEYVLGAYQRFLDFGKKDPQALMELHGILFSGLPVLDFTSPILREQKGEELYAVLKENAIKHPVIAQYMADCAAKNDPTAKYHYATLLLQHPELSLTAHFDAIQLLKQHVGNALDDYYFYQSMAPHLLELGVSDSSPYIFDGTALEKLSELAPVNADACQALLELEENPSYEECTKKTRFYLTMYPSRENISFLSKTPTLLQKAQELAHRGNLNARILWSSYTMHAQTSSAQDIVQAFGDMTAALSTPTTIENAAVKIEGYLSYSKRLLGINDRFGEIPTILEDAQSGNIEIVQQNIQLARSFLEHLGDGKTKARLAHELHQLEGFCYAHPLSPNRNPEKAIHLLNSCNCSLKTAFFLKHHGEDDFLLKALLPQFMQGSSVAPADPDKAFQVLKHLVEEKNHIDLFLEYGKAIVAKEKSPESVNKAVHYFSRFLREHPEPNEGIKILLKLVQGKNDRHTYIAYQRAFAEFLRDKEPPEPATLPVKFNMLTYCISAYIKAAAWGDTVSQQALLNYGIQRNNVANVAARNPQNPQGALVWQPLKPVNWPHPHDPFVQSLEPGLTFEEHFEKTLSSSIIIMSARTIWHDLATTTAAEYFYNLRNSYQLKFLPSPQAAETIAKGCYAKARLEQLQEGSPSLYVNLDKVRTNPLWSKIYCRIDDANVQMTDEIWAQLKTDIIAEAEKVATEQNFLEDFNAQNPATVPDVSISRVHLTWLLDHFNNSEAEKKRIRRLYGIIKEKETEDKFGVFSVLSDSGKACDQRALDGLTNLEVSVLLGLDTAKFKVGSDATPNMKIAQLIQRVKQRVVREVIDEEPHNAEMSRHYSLLLNKPLGLYSYDTSPLKYPHSVNYGMTITTLLNKCYTKLNSSFTQYAAEEFEEGLRTIAENSREVKNKILTVEEAIVGMKFTTFQEIYQGLPENRSVSASEVYAQFLKEDGETPRDDALTNVLTRYHYLSPNPQYQYLDMDPDL